MPKILKVELSEDEQNQIFDSLIERFDKTSSEKQEINFTLTEEIEVYSELELEFEIEFDESEENPADRGSITGTHIRKFTFDLFVDGESIEYKLADVSYKSKIDGEWYRKTAEDFENRIEKHFIS